jgi:hypothetical protein
MRTALFLLASLLSSAAWAERPNTLGMSCAQAQSVVASRGAIVMNTGRHTFERLVASPGYCEFGEYALTAWVPTRDARSCRVGYRCDTVPPLWVDPDRRGLFGLR